MKDRDSDIAMRAMVNEAADLYNKDDRQSARERLIQVMDTYLDGFNQSDVELMNVMIVMLEGAGDFPRVLRVARTLGRVTGGATFTLGMRFFRALAISGEKAVLRDFLVGAEESAKGQHVLIACIPKTGSTFLQSALMLAAGFAGPKLGLSYANEENMLHPETAMGLFSHNFIAQEHCRATPQNLAIAQGFAMQVVVLVRNIFDSLVSMRDMLTSDTHGSVVALFQDDLQTLDNEAQLDAIITKWAHWQLDFYTSWVRAERNGLIEAQFWTYEDIMQDKVSAVKEICRQAGLQADPAHIQACVETVDGDADLSRKNVGVSGRGRSLMTEAQIASIQSMTRFYPDIDFSPLGL